MTILFVLFPSHGLWFTQWMSSLPEFVACSFFSANQQSNHVGQDHSSWPSGCRCQREHGSNSHQHLTNCNLPPAAMIFVQWKHICETLVSTWDYEPSQVFGGRLYQQLKDEPGNIIMSPFSISGVMAMVGMLHDTHIIWNWMIGGSWSWWRYANSGAAGYDIPKVALQWSFFKV